MNTKMLKNLIPFTFLIFGLFIFFHPMFLNFDKMFGDLGDARFINYILEHGFLWFTGDSLHSSFFNAPFFYPNLNTLSYSDMLIGGMLFYIPLRFLVDSPQTALQIWVLIAFSLNFFSFYLVSRRIFKFSILISSITAFLFAFSLPRYNQIVHLQLSLHFFSVFAFYFLINSKGQTSRFIISAMFLALQFYTAFYYGWFFVFAICVAFIAILPSNKARKNVFEFIKNNIKGLSFCLITFILLIIPLFIRYVSVSTGFAYSSCYLFNIVSFLSSYSILDSFIFPSYLEKLNGEQITGIGIFTTIMTMWGFIFFKKYKLPVLLFILIVFLFYFFWRLNIFLHHVPGGGAIRAGGRAVFILLPVFCYLIGYFLSAAGKKTFIICCIIILLEQIPMPLKFHWTKTMHNARVEQYDIPKECKIFYLDADKFYPSLNVDAMWVSNKVKKPTVNGYSGFLPKIQQSVIDTIDEKCKIKISE